MQVDEADQLEIDDRAGKRLAALTNSFKRLVELVLRLKKPESAETRVARGTLETFLLKVSYVGLSFGLSLILARLMGTAGFGAYSYSLAWIVFLAVPATLGMDIFLTRQLAAYQVQSAWSLMQGVLRRTSLIVLLCSVGLGASAFVTSLWFLRRSDPQVLTTLWIALLLVPFASLVRLQQGALQGLHRSSLGQLPGMVIQPMLLLVLLAGARWIFRVKLTAPGAMGMSVLAAAAAFSTGAILLRRSLPIPAKMAAPTYQRLPWLSSIIPLVFILSMSTVFGQTDVLMLGMILGVKPVGIYSVADRAADFVTFFLMAAVPALAPTIASLYAAKDMKQLQRLVTKVAQLTLLASLPVAVGLIVFGGRLLGALYGPDFVRGQTALSILSVGQLINVGAGPVANLLAMTGYERDAAWSLGFATILNIVLNMTLIPHWGLEGAAIAAATSLSLLNVLLSALVYKRIGLHSTALGILRLRRRR